MCQDVPVTYCPSTKQWSIEGNGLSGFPGEMSLVFKNQEMELEKNLAEHGSARITSGTALATRDGTRDIGSLREGYNAEDGCDKKTTG